MDKAQKIIGIFIIVCICFMILLIIDEVIKKDCIITQEGYLKNINTKDGGELILTLESGEIVDDVEGKLDGYYLGDYIEIQECKTQILRIKTKELKEVGR